VATTLEAAQAQAPLTELPDSDRAFHVETHGVDFIPLTERWAKPRDVGALWAGASVQVEYFIYGAILMTFGFTFAQALSLIIIGNLSYFLLGLCSLQGPTTGTTVFGSNRASFGPNGSPVGALFHLGPPAGLQGEGAPRDGTKPFATKARDIVAVLDDSGSLTIRKLSFIADEDGHLFVSDPAPGISGGVSNSPQLVPGSKDLVFVHGSSVAPYEIFKASEDGSGLTALTHHNAAMLAQLDLPKAEGFSFKGADGDTVSGWLIRPPGFDPSKKYPVVFLIHGGPQGAWHDEWHNRWNYPMFAAPGYAVVAINPRGSTGYGQKFTDQISKDWTGRVFEDLMKGLDHALKTYPFLDESKMAAAGGSYGGFMVNWIAGHSDRFKALISHAGVFDLTSMYGTTEELWFAEWEFSGPPWEGSKIYLDQTPSGSIAHFKTPTLVIHGALDFRVPDAQGLGMFTALQRQGVPSRYVYFPDEGHWIAKPANRIVWWREVHDWLAKYLKH